MAGRFGKPDPTGRSSGKRTGKAAEVMRPPPGEPFVQLTRELLRSPAWQSLGINARRLMDFLLIEQMNHAALENGRLIATYPQLVEFGLSRRCIAAAIEECEAAGLVRRKRGGMRVASEYRLTFLSADGCWPTNDWKRYRAPSQTTLTREDIERSSPCGALN